MKKILITTIVVFGVLAATNTSTVSAAPAQTSRDCYSAIDTWWTPNVGPAVAQWAKKIVFREARNLPWAASKISTAKGCFQLIHSLHAGRYNKFRGWGCSPAKWANPDCNALAALDLFRTKGVGKRAWAVR
jgi:hypothetical protein